MKILEPGYDILWDQTPDQIVKKINDIGRKCYQSTTPDIPEKREDFVRMLIKRGHESVLEHANITVDFTCDVKTSMSIIRHRHTAITQESTRYCNYTKDRFGGEVAFVRPVFFMPLTNEYMRWIIACEESEKAYSYMIDILKLPAEQARTVLNFSVKADTVITASIREWRHMLKLRTPSDAHPQARQLFIPLLKDFREQLPCAFEDIPVPEV